MYGLIFILVSVGVLNLGIVKAGPSEEGLGDYRIIGTRSRPGPHHRTFSGLRSEREHSPGPGLEVDPSEGERVHLTVQHGELYIFLNWGNLSWT